MRDFTLKAYRAYLEAIAASGIPFLMFRDFMVLDRQPGRFCLIRHDVDRRPQNALSMAKVEASMGIHATYYFRMKPTTFRPDIIRAIADMGHEVGYHYESLSDTRGDIPAAISDFRQQLQRLREVTDVRTCSMHGRPLRPFDNRDIWRDPANHAILTDELGLLGEVYLDIDYTDIAYINDTGRNWTSGESNRRDKVDSRIAADFPSGIALLHYLRTAPHPRMVFQIHPERWTDSPVEWSVQLAKDRGINVVKAVLNKLRP